MLYTRLIRVAPNAMHSRIINEVGGVVDATPEGMGYHIL